MNKTVWCGAVFLALAGLVGSAHSANGNGNAYGNGNGNGNAFGKVKSAATAADVTALLSGSTVCVGSTGNWENQEMHYATGALWEYARGSGHPTDPSALIGSWSVDSAGVVTYTYGNNNKFYYTVSLVSGNTYTFTGVNGTSATVTATIKPSLGAC